MKGKLFRAVAVVLAGLISCPVSSLGLGGVNVSGPVAARTGPDGVVTPVTMLANQGVSGQGLTKLGALATFSLQPISAFAPQVNLHNDRALTLVNETAALVLQQTLRPLIPIAAAVGPQIQTGVSASRRGPAVTEKKVSQISAQAAGFLENAGPVGQTSPEQANQLGSQVFKSLLGGSDEIGGPAPSADGTGNAAAAAQALTRQKMLQTLYQVAAIFAEQYAPIDFKKERFQLDLKREYEKAKSAVLTDPQITTPQFQDILVSLVAAMRDYHVSISFFSTEVAHLPFWVLGAGGKYFLVYIDRAQLPEEVFPFQVGDEVVTFDGKPTAEVVKELAARRSGNTAETDLRLAEFFLTNRRRATGDQVPQGDIVIGIRDQAGQLQQVRMPWGYIPEMVRQDVPVRDAGLMTPDSSAGVRLESGPGDSRDAATAQASGLKRLLANVYSQAIHPLADIFEQMRNEALGNPFMIGARQSFVPNLGRVLWQTNGKDPFHAYIFQTDDGRKVGFVRISSYRGGAPQAKRFGELMAKFQNETDALVIDQINNPGGDVFYLYALASHLTDKPLVNSRHRLIIDESNAQQAAQMLLSAMTPLGLRAPSRTDGEEQEDQDDGWSGYPVTRKFMVLLIRFSKFILDQFNAGKRFTDLTHLWGVDDIDPAPAAAERYTKPILLLTSALDFSGGDFFPALMQDNKRATILGLDKGTAGAGGMVRPFELPNQFGIAHLSATWSIAARRTLSPDDPNNGQPIENRRVMADIPYELTEQDVRTGFAPYRSAILQALQGLLPAKPAVDPAPVTPAPVVALPAPSAAGTMPQQAWQAMTQTVELHGNKISPEKAASMIQRFGLPEGSILKGVARMSLNADGTAAHHGAMEYGIRDASGNYAKTGYLLLGTSRHKGHVFWLSADGGVIKAGSVDPEHGVVEQALAQMQEALQQETDFWGTASAN